jgi:tRNA threonylcarbamoyladenosine biosynthesis protein TsaE
MSTELIWQTVTVNSEGTSRLGELLGNSLTGGEVIELSADLGGGKTTFTQGLAKGLGSKDVVSSPSFTLSRIYKARDGIEIHHFDFYRLSDAGILKDQLAESLNDAKTVTVIEWSGIVKDVLPNERLAIELKPTAHDPDERAITITYPQKLIRIIEKIKNNWDETRP